MCLCDAAVGCCSFCVCLLQFLCVVLLTGGHCGTQVLACLCNRGVEMRIRASYARDMSGFLDVCQIRGDGIYHFCVGNLMKGRGSRESPEIWRSKGRGHEVKYAGESHLIKHHSPAYLMCVYAVPQLG